MAKGLPFTPTPKTPTSVTHKKILVQIQWNAENGCGGPSGVDLLEADEAEWAEEQAVDKAEPPLKKRKYLLVLILAN